MLADKTGSLIATSAEFGAHFAGVPATMTDSLRRVRLSRSAIAFQLSDDILDIASDSDESGKTPGTDLREGVATLPVLYALRGDDPAERPAARSRGRNRWSTTSSTPRRWCCCGASDAMREARATLALLRRRGARDARRAAGRAGARPPSRRCATW